MKNIQLCIITLFFTSLLMGCGMKGPLYHAPVKQPSATEKAELQSAQEKTEDTRESE